MPKKAKVVVHPGYRIGAENVCLAHFLNLSELG